MYEYKVMNYLLEVYVDYDENGKCFLVDSHSCESKLNASMNKMAEDGWKVISVVSHVEGQVTVFYERKIK